MNQDIAGHSVTIIDPPDDGTLYRFRCTCGVEGGHAAVRHLAESSGWMHLGLAVWNDPSLLRGAA